MTSQARYRIGAVAAMTGISAHALRAWERRYSLAPSGRSPGGTRLYSDEDVDRLRLIKRLLDGGHAIGSVFDLEREELLRLGGQLTPAAAAATAASEPLDDVRARVLRAVGELDLAGAERTLGHASLTLDPDRMVQGVVLPLARGIGDRWESGDARVTHEHALSALLRNVLGSMLRAGGSGPVVVVTTPAGELHELGALGAAVLAQAADRRVIYLGPNLPADEILFAVRRARADVLALSVVMRGQPGFAGELATVASRLPAAVKLIAGGDGAREHVEALGKRARVLGELGELSRALG